MRARSTLTQQQREQLVELFDKGYGSHAVANHLEIKRHPAQTIHRRYKLRGKLCIMEKPTKQYYTYDTKKEVVTRFLAGHTKMELTSAYNLSSDQVVTNWVRAWRAGGDQALVPKPRSRPKGSVTPKTLTEEQRLRRRIEKLEAEKGLSD